MLTLNWVSILENCEKRKLRSCKRRVILGGNWAVRKVAKTKNQRLMSKMGKSKEIIPDIDDTIRNS